VPELLDYDPLASLDGGSDLLGQERRCRPILGRQATIVGQAILGSNRWRWAQLYCVMKLFWILSVAAKPR
jgi:hypothetical protein